jgi:hypothetical protein
MRDWKLGIVFWILEYIQRRKEGGDISVMDTAKR